jgi:hypothetical protein
MSMSSLYRSEILFQLHKLVGSLDLLGNPISVLTRLREGFLQLVTDQEEREIRANVYFDFSF